MITAIIILVLAVVLGAIFIANAIPALMIAKGQHRKAFFPSWLLVLSGIVIVLIYFGFILLTTLYYSKIETENNPPKYEQIQGPVYRQVK